MQRMKVCKIRWLAWKIAIWMKTAIRQSMDSATKKGNTTRWAMDIVRVKWIRSPKPMPSAKPNKKHRKKWNAALLNPENISTLMLEVVMVAAAMLQEEAAVVTRSEEHTSELQSPDH